MFEFVTAHSAEILSGLALVLAIAAFVVKFTPNKTDDAVVAQIEAVLGKYLPHVEIKPAA